MSESNIEQATFAYDLGFCPIALREGEKQPLVRYKNLLEQGKRHSLQKALGPLKKHPSRNVGVLLGQLSGGIIAIDFDNEDDYQQWCDDHPAIARVLPTVVTKRGYHVYLRSEEGYCESRDLRPFGINGEVKGDRTLTVFAGSKVGDHEYRWSIPPNPENGIPTIPLIDSGLLPEAFIESHLEHRTAESDNKSVASSPSNTLPNIGTEHDGTLRNTTERNRSLQNTTEYTPASSGLTSNELLRDIESHRIFGVGQRNAKLFQLALRLHHEMERELAIKQACNVHDYWWKLYGEHCTTPKHESEEEFVGMVTRIIKVESFLLELSERSLAEPTPAFAKTFPDKERYKAACRVFACADRLVNGGVFFLTMETINDMCGFKSKRAVKSFIETVTKGLSILELVKKGNERRANRYRLLINPDGARR